MIETQRREDKNVRIIRPAEFVTFRYRNEEGEHSEREVIVMAYDEEKELLHALDLDKFTEETLLQTAREIAAQSQERERFEEQLDEENVLYLPDVLDRDIEHWYETEYSPDRYEDNPYRTFLEGRIRNLRRIEVSVV